jgi:DNA-binding Lrp family transcriptional regulator
LTDIDDSLVNLLRQDGRASFSELATRLHLPRAVVAARVHSLIADDAIRVTAAVHPELLGLNSIGHVSIRTTGPHEPAVAALVADPAVVLVSAVSGSFDLVAEIRLPSHPELYAKVAEVRALPHVGRLETLVYVDIPFGTLQPQRPRPGTRLDATDRRLVTLLSADGRMSYAALGAALGISAPAARKRVVGMLEDGMLRIGATRSRRGHHGPVAAGIGLNVADRDVDDVVNLLRETDGIEFVATTLGRFDLIATLGAAAQRSLNQRIEEIRAAPGIVGVESWIHLHVLKERYGLGSPG